MPAAPVPRSGDNPAPATAPYVLSARLALFLILALTFAVYGRTLGFEFVYDDKPQIIENKFIQSWDAAPRYFTEHVWSYAFPNDPGNYYRPVFLLWLLLHYMLFGDNPAVWHLSVVLTHVAATWLVYLVGRRIFPDHLFVPLVAALLFGVHPVHIESVAWVSGVTDPLLALFLFGSLLAYLRYRDGPHSSPGQRTLSLAASLVLCALALLTKETAAVLPAFVFVHSWILPAAGAVAPAGLAVKLRRALKHSWPYLALAALFMVVRASVLGGLGHRMVTLDAATILFTWPSMLWSYAKLLLWPFSLSGFYDAPYVNAPALVQFWWPLLAIAVLAVGVVVSTRRQPRLAVCALWMALPLLPLLHLEAFQLHEFIHDRYLYLSSVGFCLLLAAGIHQLREVSARRVRFSLLHLAVVALLGGAWSAATLWQSGIWRDDYTLYQHSVLVAPENNLALNNLATVLEKRGQLAKARQMYEAIVARRPDHWLALFNLGHAQYRSMELEAAENTLMRALRLNPAFPEAHLYLGLVRFRMERVEEARQSIERATQMNPRARGFHFALGVVYRYQGNLRAALDAFKKELENDPSQAAAVAQILAIESKMRAVPPPSANAK